MTAPLVQPRHRPLPRPVRLGAAALFLLVLAYVAWGSLTPAPPSPAAGYDKLQHFVAYALLALLGFAAAPDQRNAVLMLVLAVGGGIEVAQAALPLGRAGSIPDFAADAAGAGLVFGVWRLLEKRRRG